MYKDKVTVILDGLQLKHEEVIEKVREKFAVKSYWIF